MAFNPSGLEIVPAIQSQRTDYQFCQSRNSATMSTMEGIGMRDIRANEDFMKRQACFGAAWLSCLGAPYPTTPDASALRYG